MFQRPPLEFDAHRETALHIYFSKALDKASKLEQYAADARGHLCGGGSCHPQAR